MQHDLAAAVADFDAVALADFSEDASERLFLERYRRQMSRYVGEGDEAARPRRLAEG